ncbi:AT-hook motif nuclear-localized protein 17-like [Mangifera indica]|uniref:AT-hook motif nuclear-localized protein 17-like n=1 Tax=Mangifera indica TaxID=29780 RepID=UPI001CFBBE68|nr:AT-hook motif nuclear-localized protein 17-like [Mangifera indica]
MKGEYLEPKTANSPGMFSKLHHQQHHQHPFSHHFQLSRDSPTSEEETNSHNSASAATPAPKLKQHEPGDGATIEVVRRPRGRPPGSKNKPRPPVFITREPETVMSPYILEVAGGNDVVEAISNFCHRKSLGICVLSGSGTVANVTLRQPSPTPGATITFHGRFDVLSISATFLPQNGACLPVPNIFAISLAGPQGQIVGGSVVGPLIAAGTVFLVAATFNNPSYHRLSVQDEPRTSVSGGGEGQSPVGSSGGGGGGGAESEQVAGGESCGMSMYSCHLPGDVIWAPTARPPPPPY